MKYKSTKLKQVDLSLYVKVLSRSCELYKYNKSIDRYIQDIYFY